MVLGSLKSKLIGNLTYPKLCSTKYPHLRSILRRHPHVPRDLAERVDQMALRLERSRGWIVKQALMAWIEQEEERSRLTREALADVDAGHIIDHQSVQAWADSLDDDAPLQSPR